MKKRLLEEIQGRLLRRCGLSSLSKRKDGVLHLFVNEAIHLAYIEKSLTEDVEKLWIMVLEDMSKNWQRFGYPKLTEKLIAKI